jgi:DNA segregation ATPase FtsK/SpoIIIE-like protein
MNHHRFTRSAALGLALVALAAPIPGAASAAPIPDAQTRLDMRSPDTRDAVQAAQAQQDMRSPDSRDAVQAAQAQQDMRSPDSRDASTGSGTYTSPQVVIVKPQPQPAAANGIDWADAGIGAGSLLGLSLLGLGGALFIVHRKRTARAAPPVAGM